MKKNIIYIKGAKEHNLKVDELEIPKEKLIVFTGVSGSGKSSLAFDTLYAEGQRRYVESLSSYARQFLGQMEKPKYEKLRGLSPTIAIEQKAASSNPRSTVGTITEVYDYMRVFWARVGKQTCHKCGKEVAALTSQQLIDEIQQLPPETKAQLLAPLVINRKGTFKDVLNNAKERGFVRMKIDEKVYRLDEEIPPLDKNKKHNLELVIDRIVVGKTDSSRLTDSIETALSESDNQIFVDIENSKTLKFSINRHCVNCAISFPELSPQSFSFNSPLGACESCNGLGTRLEMDPNLVVPNKDLSIWEGAIAPFAMQLQRAEGWNAKIFEALEREMDVNLNTPWKNLSAKKQNLVLYGSGNKKVKVNWRRESSSYKVDLRFEGVANTLMRRLQQTNSQQMREFYNQFLSSSPCSACNGARLKPESQAALINKKGIHEITAMSVLDAKKWFKKLNLKGTRGIVAQEILKEIGARLSFLTNVGLSYLSLNRLGPSLSGGEAQRIRLASQLGSELSGVLYVLDEPSIGLHPRDGQRLLNALEGLRDLGNTVIVVEHDKETMQRANHIVDFGPGAGQAGGRVVAQGTLKQIINNPKSITGAFLSGKKKITIPKTRRKPTNWLSLKGASLNNLKNVNLDVPLGGLIVFSGVSGAGKSSLLSSTLLPVLQKKLLGSTEQPGPYDKITGLEAIDKVISINQKPIGRTPRSNPATYTKAFDEIRKIFAQTSEAKAFGFDQGRFSFNVKGGRCEACSGAGVIKVEMHFLADVHVPCEVCKGHRYNEATLRVRFKSRNIKEILSTTVSEAKLLFKNHPKLARILKTLEDVGMGYVQLGQSAITLSGGEAQRIKLSKELAKRGTGKTIYILDEPTTGLHFEDIKKLLLVLQRLVDQGNTVLVIEHNLDVIKCADWIIDMGPEGGEQGGKIIATGTPEKLAKSKVSYTGKYLKEVLSI